MRKFAIGCAAFGALASMALWGGRAHAQVITDPVTGITIDLGGGGTGGGVTDPGGGVTDPGGAVTDPGGAVTDPGGGVTDPGGGSVPGVRYADQIKFHVHWSTVDASGQTWYRDTEYWYIDYHDENGQSVNYEYKAYTGPVVSIGASVTDASGLVWTVYDEDVETGDRWRW